MPDKINNVIQNNMSEKNKSKRRKRKIPPGSHSEPEASTTSSDEKNISSNKPEIQSMETHAHHLHKAPGKKFRHYLYEFLMLFLAVFCGFLAEYQLEHKIERDRANELAKNFYDELKNDSAIVLTKAEFRIKQENALKYLMKYFKDSSLINVSKAFELNFMYGINFRSPSLFEPRTVVLDQLKNSGSLRYFRNDELQRLIGDLSIAIHNINDRQALESSVRIEHINPIIIRHQDYDFNEILSQNGKVSVIKATFEYEKNNEFIPFQFKSPEKFDKQGTINALGFMCMSLLNSTRTLHFQKYIDTNAELLKILREEYHLK
ncbi:MAG: hypothetical protein ACHQNT_03900 [Bacteroidia bacterium]